MKVVTEAKTKEEALNKALKELKLNLEDIMYKEENVKGKLFKANTIKIIAIPKEDILNSIKEFIKDVVNKLGIDVNFETSIRENQFNIKMFSDNNAILIGKNGRTMKSIEMLAKQKILVEYGLRVKIFLDVENYNEKRIKQLERLAITTAKEVSHTKVEAVLDNMNSYERRIIHNKLTDFKGVTTISEGEEPNRHIIIKPE
jgi:spoIIIJ-associated protein